MAHSAQEQPDHLVMIHSAKRLALDMGTEDSCGLWELLWDMRQEFAGVSDHQLIDASSRGLLDLLVNRLVDVVWWDLESDVETFVAPDGAEPLLTDESNWHPPEGGNVRHLRFFATQSGEQAYYAGLTGPSPIRRGTPP